LEILRKFK